MLFFFLGMDPIYLDLDVRYKLRSDGKLHNKFILIILTTEENVIVKPKLLIIVKPNLLIPHFC